MEGKPLPYSKRYTVFPDGKVLKPNGKPAKFSYGPTGIKQVCFSDHKGIPYRMSVARLVGELFCPDYRSHLRAVYKDGNRDNVSVDNLQWVDWSLLSVAPKGNKRKTAKLDDKAVREIRNSKENALDLAEKYGVSRNHIYSVRRNLNWKHVE